MPMQGGQNMLTDSVHAVVEGGGGGGGGESAGGQNMPRHGLFYNN